MLKPGDSAPDFFLSNTTGKKIKLSDYLGHKIALYFYPKDDTSGCTKQACSLRDGIAELVRNNIVVLGISTDDENSHRKFTAKYKLPFTLLCDIGAVVANKYGVWGIKKFLGKEFAGMIRTTFLINEKGKIVKIIEKPNTDDHAVEILSGFEAAGSP